MRKEHPKYEVDEPVIYTNGDKVELGIVKKVCGKDDYFVNYHTGDTAARTHASHLMKVSNRYAFHIVRLDPDGNERKKIVGTTTVDKAFERFLLDTCPDVKKKLKALEIIKKKGIDITALKDHKKAKTYNEHSKFARCKDYTDEEFDLIKEVME